MLLPVKLCYRHGGALCAARRTKGAIEEPRCLAHLFRACTNNVPVVPIYLNSSATKHAPMAYEFDSAAPFLKALHGNLSPSERVELEKATGASASQVGRELARFIPNIISKHLDVDSLESQFKVRAQIEQCSLVPLWDARPNILLYGINSCVCMCVCVCVWPGANARYRTDTAP